MEYFAQYLQRLNQDGENFQERVVTSREKRFAKFLTRSTYSSKTIMDEKGNLYQGSIHPEKDSEKTCIYKFLSFKSDDFQTGQLIFNDYNTWLITHKSLDKTKGYKLYTLMLLPQTLTILNGKNIGTSFPVRLTNDSGEEIKDFFSTITGVNRQYREPDRELKAICKKYDFLEKDLKFEIEEDTYKIEGINKTAVPGCVYLTLGQCLTDAARHDSSSDETDESFWGDN